MKRKVIRGGSWKDTQHYIRSDVRTWEYQNEQRSFVGFRCVRTYLGGSKGTKSATSSKSSKSGGSSAARSGSARPSGGGGTRSVRR